MVHSVVAFEGRIYASHESSVYEFDSSLSQKSVVERSLNHLTLSEDGKFLAGVEHDHKQVTVLDTSNLETVVATHEFPKRPSGIAISGSNLAVCDKFGDVFSRNLQESSTSTKETEPILGHVSMVLDVKFADPHSIITSDRDEHIRVSRFPKSYVIERFLLGHESYVSHLAVSGPYLVSGGGDHYVLAWNWQTGEQLAKLDVAANVIALAISGSRVCIAMEEMSEVIEASVPDLEVAKRFGVGGPVQDLTSLDGRWIAALPSGVVDISGETRHTFESRDSELNSEKHLKKRSIDRESEDVE